MNFVLIIIFLGAAYIALPFIFSLIGLLFPILLIFAALSILGFLGKK